MRWAVLAAFSLFVTLSGTPPITREDLTPFDPATDLHGFNVYCGTSSGDYQDTYNFTGYDLPTTEWPVPLDNNKHYCVVTAVDKNFRESLYSVEIIIPNQYPQPPQVYCEPNADLNGDGVVNAADLAILKSQFFERYLIINND